MAKYQRQLHEGEQLAAEILEQAEAERAGSKPRCARISTPRSSAAPSRRWTASPRRRQRALQEVRARAADLAVRTTRRLLTEQLGPDQSQRLIGGAIEDVGRKLN